ncbi:hypothetical protein [Bacillus sp. FJAT-29814]|uniref:hypothetical protein n=1 Tax=Bacillus sp. FJAT-29814 TaxID=1729688 RepID=UPI000833918B|nr:hypothetical protein [Bacillus sp. FJAT-29814]
MVEKITGILNEIGFANISYDYRDDNSYYFDAYSDVLVEIRVGIDGEVAKVFEKYITDKHFVFFGNFYTK